MLAATTLTTDTQTIYIVPSGKDAVVSILLCNMDSSNAHTAYVYLNDKTLLNISLQPGETFQLTQLVLNSNDKITAKCDTNDVVNIFITGIVS